MPITILFPKDRLARQGGVFGQEEAETVSEMPSQTLDWSLGINIVSKYYNLSASNNIIIRQNTAL